MRIAVFLETAPTDGGAFQQALSTIEMLARESGARHEFVVFTPFRETRQLLFERHGIAAIRFRSRLIRHLDMLSATRFGEAILRRLRSIGFRRLGRHLDALLDDHGIDLVLLTDVTEVGLRIGHHPFIATVMDLDHRDHPEYPEHFIAWESEKRDRILRSTLPRALAVIANSSSGTDRIASLYHVERGRIIGLPFVPSVAVRRRASASGLPNVATVRAKYELPERYVFYPAYYVFHKNHLYLLEGLVELERKHGLSVHAVFCGADPRGDRAVLEQQARTLGLMGRVRFLGLVPDEDIPALYDGAFAVVSPSPFGPTNLQPIEAVTLGRPVICADLPGCREQMGTAALYCDLADPSTLAAQLASLVHDPDLVVRLRHAGHALADTLAKLNYGEQLARLFDDYAYVRRRWAWPEPL